MVKVMCRKGGGGVAEFFRSLRPLLLRRRRGDDGKPTIVRRGTYVQHVENLPGAAFSKRVHGRPRRMTMNGNVGPTKVGRVLQG